MRSRVRPRTMFILILALAALIVGVALMHGAFAFGHMMECVGK